MSKFILTENFLRTEFSTECSHIVLLVDYNYWADHLKDLQNWCKEYDCVHQGMTVAIKTPELYTLFVLQWA